MYYSLFIFSSKAQQIGQRAKRVLPNSASVPNLDNAAGIKQSKKLNSIKAKLKQTTTVANYRPETHTTRRYIYLTTKTWRPQTWLSSLFGHVRYINILTWLRGFRVKNEFFKSFFCLSIPKRDLNIKKTPLNIVFYSTTLLFHAQLI